MTDPNKQIPKFLKEEPSDSDMFLGGGHQRTAFALIDFIRSDQDIGIVGLEGDLGTGKSTVVEIVKESINEKNNDIDPDVYGSADEYIMPNKENEGKSTSLIDYQFLIFDLGEHSHSSIRKSLVVALHEKITKLLQDNSTDSFSKIEKLDIARDIALGRKLDIQRKIKSERNGWLLPFVFLFAVSVKYIFEAVENTIDTFLILISPVSEYYFDLGGTLTAIAGFSVLFLIALKHIVDCLNGSDDNKVNLIDLYKKNSSDNVIENIRVDRDIHSFELRKVLDEFVGLIPNDTMLILVVDNIDRIEARLVQEVWSDLNIVSSISSAKFKVILPYSEVKLAKALSDEDDDYSITGREYVSKRLPVVLRTPPIVSVNWREYLSKYWSEAKMEVGEVDSVGYQKAIHNISNLIDIWKTEPSDVTPRFLKSLINRIISSKILCPQTDINPVCYAAYHLAYRDHVSLLQFSQLVSVDVSFSDKLNFVKEDSNSVRDSEKEMFYKKIYETQQLLIKELVGSESSWSQQLSCIHFQTDLETAQSELLKNPIEGAIKNSDAESILNLSNLYGFETFFPGFIESTMPELLYKLLASVSEVKSEASVNFVNRWLEDINNWSNFCAGEGSVRFGFHHNSFGGIKSLLFKGYEVDLSRAKKRLKHFDDNFSGVDTESIKEVYMLSGILDEEPKIIQEPSLELFWRVIWSNRESFPRWNIHALNYSTQYRKELLRDRISKLRKDNISDDVLQFFKSLNSSNCFGDKFDESITIRNNILDFPSVDFRVEILPYSNLWGEETFHDFMNAIFVGDDSENVSRQLACMVAYTANVNSLMKHSSVIPDSPQNYAIDVIEKQNLGDEFVNNLADFLIFLSENKFFDLVANEQLGVYALKAIVKLISESRFNNFNFSTSQFREYVYPYILGFCKGNERILVEEWYDDIQRR